ncbi:hypothetical protein CC77DRAFT_1014988 [Alternaria alternata]|uniref:Uncharacterized protein n=1 Tax=Alternaria alternata TaxID=5599 RepID=A0A177D1G5_ALTAL|nr:hypothetical protein CC77DRAFT_1014988 [Alternaria alternata]XP_051585739.1 uncharacterized protein J4E82_008228 [Alternaria postmessia]KAI5373036.1 hypothetical protein J4E82_008228 [Alternaria postmessia]OAG13258.1 hypothetical protein CC77DRAFT_1014988 [Alternaria alternata]
MFLNIIRSDKLLGRRKIGLVCRLLHSSYRDVCCSLEQQDVTAHEYKSVGISTTAKQQSDLEDSEAAKNIVYRSAWLHIDDCLGHNHLPYTSLAGIFVIVIVAILVSSDIIDIRIQLTHLPI